MTISLDREAPEPSGVTIALSSDNNTVVLPASITIAAGSTTHTISISIPSTAAAGNVHFTASFNGSRTVTLQICAAGGSPPTSPAVSAIPGAGSVTLNWTAVSGLTYNVKRSSTAGGPYTIIFAGLNAPPYVDTTVINGQTYYYVVSALNCAGEGLNSTEVSAAPSCGQVATPIFYVEEGGFNLDLIDFTNVTTGASVHYTLDGSEPTEGSPLYSGPIQITKTTTVKAKAFKTGCVPSNTAVQAITISIDFIGQNISCGFYSTGETLCTGGSCDYSWAEGAGFYAKHYECDFSDDFSEPQTVVITMASSEINNSLYLYDGYGGTVTFMTSNHDDGTGSGNAKITWTAQLDHSYYIEATSTLPGETGTYTFFLDCGTTAPQIAVHDNSNPPVTINNSQTVAFGNVAIGTTSKTNLFIQNVATASTASGLNIGQLQMAGNFIVNPKFISEIPPPLGSATITVPFTVSLTATTLGSQQGTLTIASDDTAHSPFLIYFTANVINPNQIPQIAINSPSSNESIPDGTYPDASSILIQTTTTPAGYPIAKVEFFANGAKIGQATTAPYSLTWIGAQPGSGAQPATYQLTAKATDTVGRQGTTTETTTITVSAPILTGTPAITPASGNYPGSINVTINQNTLPDGATMGSA